MSEYILIGLTSVLVLGISAQWIAWRTKFPAILVLLGVGILSGPITGLISPDELMGNLLTPFVSISVAIILFEGGLSLRMSEFRKIGGIVVKLITIGVLVTWLLSTLASLFFLDIGLELSILFGAVLIVTGPTVIMPLLRQVRPTEPVNSILKWEGIINDPIGAMMSVLVFEIIISGGFSKITETAGLIILDTLFYGIVLGAIAAGFMYIMLKKHWIPEFLQNPVTLMVVITTYTVSDSLQHESGLLAVTAMGVFLANQKSVRIQHIIKFKENLQVLLISALFILLAARLEVSHLAYFNLSSAIFIALMFLVVRPATIFISAIGSKISIHEKLFLAWMAPRGLVAAAISAIFALRLEAKGYEAADKLVPYTFLVIISTVTIYGLSASPLARLLNVAKPQPNGVIIIGAHTWARNIAETLHKLGIKVLLADSNWQNISFARKSGLETYYGNILSEYAFDEINLDGIGRVLSLTPNNEVNSLASIRFAEELGISKAFQLAPIASSQYKNTDVSGGLSGRTLFDSELNYVKITELIEAGASIKNINVSENFDFKTFKNSPNSSTFPLFVVTSIKMVVPYSVDNPPSPQEGDILIALVQNTFDDTIQEK
ncbi:MAG: cation:proton antiporter [Balneolaceae bacterium]